MWVSYWVYCVYHWKMWTRYKKKWVGANFNNNIANYFGGNMWWPPNWESGLIDPGLILDCESQSWCEPAAMILQKFVVSICMRLYIWYVKISNICIYIYIQYYIYMVYNVYIYTYVYNLCIYVSIISIIMCLNDFICKYYQCTVYIVQGKWWSSIGIEVPQIFRSTHIIPYPS